MIGYPIKRYHLAKNVYEKKKDKNAKNNRTPSYQSIFNSSMVIIT